MVKRADRKCLSFSLVSFQASKTPAWEPSLANELMICPPLFTAHSSLLAQICTFVEVDRTQVCLFVPYWYWNLIYEVAHACIMYELCLAWHACMQSAL